MTDPRDAAWMARALSLAERGRGRTTPNPLVGAVVVSDDGEVVGEGAHLVAGGPHAEALALDAAGSRARGATLYCTMEPCCHTGRTGPCVERIAASGIRRVVTAIEDPNPLVCGGGVRWLVARGIVVDVGVGGADAQRQNAPFLTWMTHARPFTLLKTATSRDGFVGRIGERVELSGPQTNRAMHRQRAWIDAIAVGAGTVLADDPLLTARGVYRHRPLTRVIVDWRCRVPLGARVFSTPSAGPVIMVVLASAAGDLAAFETRGVVVESFGDRNLQEVVRRLAARGIQSLLLEGGPTLQAACLDAGVVDWLQWIVSPVVLGAGVPMASRVRDRLDHDARASRTVMGADVLIEGPWD